MTVYRDLDTLQRFVSIIEGDQALIQKIGSAKISGIPIHNCSQVHKSSSERDIICTPYMVCVINGPISQEIGRDFALGIFIYGLWFGIKKWKEKPQGFPFHFFGHDIGVITHDNDGHTKNFRPGQDDILGYKVAGEDQAWTLSSNATN